MKNKKLNTSNNTDDPELEPLVEIMKYSKVQKGDVLILRCEKGTEHDEIKKMHSALRLLIEEKDLRILAVNPGDKMEHLYLHIEAAKNFKEEFVEEQQVD